MPEKPNDVYGTYGSVPTVPSEGGGAKLLDTRASPDAFGGQIGEAISKSGARTEQFGSNVMELATHFAQEATEAKVNDDYANKYAPAAANLRAQYDGLRGQDKIHGYDGYINSLQDLNRQFTGSQASPYGKQIMSSLLDRHISGEIDGAKRELVESQKQFADQAAADKIMADVNDSASNYNNPARVAQNEASIDSTVLLRHMDKGLNPNDPDHQDVIADAQKAAKGQMAVSMIQNAVSRGDVTAANQIRTDYSGVIPGYQQDAIDKTLHTENIRQAGVNGTAALVNGQPLPHTPGAPPAQVQAVVADTAHNNGLDPNHALTVANIESKMGQDLGTRGDIGQTGKGGNLQEQASNMVTELKKSEKIASNTLGRPAEPWEQYVVYQQGSGGGPALLKAATENPTAKAIDVLAPLYKNPKDARDAIVGNGGNATMTAGDYLKFVHSRYDANAQRATCDFSHPQGDSQTAPGQAILAPHTQGGEVVQPAASPRQALNNFDEKLPAIMDRVSSIPNFDVRSGVLRAVNQRREMLHAASTAYSSQLVNKATQLAVSPKFTDMNQVPSDMASALLSEHPETMRYLENAAKQNLERGSGGSSKDMKEYGSGMFGLMRDINEGKITSSTELMKHLPGNDGTGGDITLAGFDKLKGLLAKDPETQAETMEKTQAFKALKREVSGEDDGLGIKDPKGEKLWANALPKLFKAIEDGKHKNLTSAQLYDPESPDYIGNSIKGLKRSSQQMQMDLLGAIGDTASPAKGQAERTLDQIIKEAQATNDPARKAALKQEAITRGFIREGEAAPQAPISR